MEKVSDELYNARERNKLIQKKKKEFVIITKKIFEKSLKGLFQQPEGDKKEKSVEEKEFDRKVKKFKEDNFIKIGKFNKCPYCKKKLKRLNKTGFNINKKCIYCNSLIVVKTRLSDNKRVMLTKEEAKRINEEWSLWYNKKKDEFKAEIYKKNKLKECSKLGCIQYGWVTHNKSNGRMKNIFTMKRIKDQTRVIFGLNEIFKRYSKSLNDWPASIEEVEAIKCIKKLTIKDKKKIVDIFNKMWCFYEMNRLFVHPLHDLFQVWEKKKPKYNLWMIDMITQTERKRITEVASLLKWHEEGFRKVMHRTHITPQSGNIDRKLNGKVFEIEYLLSPKGEKDRIPLHPNCRCRYELYE